jgi:hypothetical protein
VYEILYRNRATKRKIPEIIKAAVAKTISRDEAEAEISTALEEYILAAAKFEARVTFIFRRAVSTADGSVDWAELADYLTLGGRITPQIRRCLIDILEGRQKQPRGMTKHQRTMREMDIVTLVVKARAQREKNALQNKGRTERQVSRYLTKHKKWAKYQEGLEALLTDLANARNNMLGDLDEWLFLNRTRTLSRYGRYNQRGGLRTAQHFGAPDDISCAQNVTTFLGMTGTNNGCA